MLERFWVGSLSHPSEHPTFPPMSQFYLTLKQKVEDHFKETRTKHNQGTVLVFASVFLVLATLLSYVGAVFTAQVGSLRSALLTAPSSQNIFHFPSPIRPPCFLGSLLLQCLVLVPP